MEQKSSRLNKVKESTVSVVKIAIPHCPFVGLVHYTGIHNGSIPECRGAYWTDDCCICCCHSSLFVVMICMKNED